MARKRHTAEEIVAKLRQVDVLMAQGRQVWAMRSLEAYQHERNALSEPLFHTSSR